MAAVLPCASAGEIADALNVVDARIGDAHHEAERIFGAAAQGLATPDQVARANDLRVAALKLATVLGVVWAADLAGQIPAASATPSQRAA